MTYIADIILENEDCEESDDEENEVPAAYSIYWKIFDIDSFTSSELHPSLPPISDPPHLASLLSVTDLDAYQTDEAPINDDDSAFVFSIEVTYRGVPNPPHCNVDLAILKNNGELYKSIGLDNIVPEKVLSSDEDYFIYKISITILKQQWFDLLTHKESLTNPSDNSIDLNWTFMLISDSFQIPHIH